MSWAVVQELLGPGLHWGKSEEHIRNCIREAEFRGERAAAEHLRIILERRNRVQFESKKTPD